MFDLMLLVETADLWWTRVPFSGGENPLKILSTKTKKDTMPFSMYCIYNIQETAIVPAFSDC